MLGKRAYEGAFETIFTFRPNARQIFTRRVQSPPPNEDYLLSLGVRVRRAQDTTGEGFAQDIVDVSFDTTFLLTLPLSGLTSCLLGGAQTSTGYRRRGEEARSTVID